MQSKVFDHLTLKIASDYSNISQIFFLSKHLIKIHLEIFYQERLFHNLSKKH